MHLYTFQKFALCLFSFLVLAGKAPCQRNCITLPAAGSAGSEYRPGGRIFEKEIARFLREESEKSTLSDNDSLYYIPVVVHILHAGEAEGSGRNLSLERILSQIDILNQDFGRQPGSPGFNSHPAGADTRIRFCLANKDPDGNPSQGIIRVNAGPVSIDAATQGAQIKSYSYWNPERYLNLWVCSLQNKILGFASYPVISPYWADSLPSPPSGTGYQTDGIAIDYHVFGNVPAGESGPYPTYNKGRTASHEVGHFLGLMHIWGDGNACADNKTDFCSDTPPQATFTSGCPPNPASCLTGVAAMKENYMDYTNDVCMNLFTEDQKQRMRIVLRNCIRRKSLLRNGAACGRLPEVAGPQPATLQMRFLADTDELELLPSELEIAEWQLFDLPGRLLKSHKPEKDFASYPQRISLSGLETGAYFLRVKEGSGRLRQLSFRQF